jgi:RNA polymerase sigma-70 factor (ECF subfamily)
VTLSQLPERPQVHPLPDEPALVARLRQGDMDALSGLYQLHAQALLGLARRLTGSLSDAEDVVQDLFVGLPEAIHRYQEQGYLRGWLRRITIRLALMRIRAGRLRREETIEAHSPSVQGNEGRDTGIREAMDRLSPDDRAIVILKVVEGYDHREIAELLGIRRGTSEVRLHRALARLRQMLEVEDA